MWKMVLVCIVCLGMLTSCRRPKPPPPTEVGDAIVVPPADVREARLRPRKHHAPLPLAPEESSNSLAGNGEDCTVYCATRFGKGVGVTCQAALDNMGVCHGHCYYENGYWFDAVTGQMIRQPGGTGDQRPDLKDVPPFGYATENGYAEDTWLECPWKGRGPTPMIGEYCLAMARSDYHEGYAFCGQAP